MSRRDVAVGGSSLTISANARRLVYRALTRAPAGAVGRARASARLGPVFEAVQAVAGAPLYGHAFPVAAGPGAGLMIVAERRALAWLSGHVETEVQAALVEHLRPGSTFVDVGASVGFFTLLAGRIVGPGGSVIAFEPQPGAACSARQNATLNGLSMVQVIEAAVGGRTGNAALHGVGKATAYVLPDGDRNTLRVETTTLDDHFAASPRVPTLVKIDVEGHEREVVAGMTRLLADSSPVLVVETHGTTEELRSDLAQRRYTTTSLGRTHLLCAPAR